MKNRYAKLGFIAATGLATATCQAQVADLLNTFDAGTRSSGLGSSLTATSVESLSAYYNPAALGYLTHSQIDLGFRNLPRSTSTVADSSGSRASTSNEAGVVSITNLGYALPVSNKSYRGTLGINYSTEGYVDDKGSANEVPYGSSTTEVAANYADHLESKTNYLSLGYGKANASQSLSYGASVLVAMNSIQYRQQYDVYDTSGSSPVLLSSQDTGAISGTSYGVGAVVGLEYLPPKIPTLSLGASLKSPIKLSGNSVTNYYDTIPGRLLLGSGLRLAGLHNRSNDYLLLGLQFEEYFGGSGSGLLQLQNDSGIDVGAEYGVSFSNFIVPLHLGYRSFSSEGPEFADRNEFTVGFGFRDKDNHYGLDLSWGLPRGSATNFEIAASYRFINP